MSDSSPLIPQGSLLEQQSKGRPHLRIMLCIVAVHLVFLGGLLMQGCKRDELPETAELDKVPQLDLMPTGEVRSTPPGLPEPEPEPEVVVVEEGNQIPTLPMDLVALLGEEGAETAGSSQTASSEPDTRAPEQLTPGNRSMTAGAIPTAPPAGTQDYIVQRGDSFYAIGRRFKVSAAEIARANPGVDALSIQPGQTLKIPAPAVGASAAPAPGATGNVYVVKKGDTLTKIAREQGTTVEALKRVNNLVTDRILIDQRLKLP